jgi:hypothetical protein
MPSTYTPIATSSATGSTITFSSISGTYTDLILQGTAVSGSSNCALTLQFNGDTGNNYSVTILLGDGSSAQSAFNNNSPSMQGGRASTAGSAFSFSIQNYSNSTTYKTALSRGSYAGSATLAYVGLWRNTSAITSITVGMTGGNSFASGSQLTLYGIEAA